MAAPHPLITLCRTRPGFAYIVVDNMQVGHVLGNRDGCEAHLWARANEPDQEPVDVLTGRQFTALRHQLRERLQTAGQWWTGAERPTLETPKFTAHPLTAELRRIREDLGIGQKLLADWLGLHRMTVYAWEHGINQPRLAEVERWAELLGYEITLQRREEKEEAA